MKNKKAKTGDILFKKIFSLIISVLIAGVFITTVFVVVSFAATLTVNNTVACDDFSGTPYCTIGAAIAGANPGDTIMVSAGTYTENITINKKLTIEGTGSSVSDTIIKSGTGNTPVININSDSTSGSSAVDRLVIKNLRVTGATGSSGSGIRVTGTISGAYMTFENIASVNNGGSGIAIDHTGAVTDVKVISSTLSDNSASGFLIPSSIGSFNGLTINSSQIISNGQSGLNVNPIVTSNLPIDNIQIDNTTFAYNGTAAQNQSDISLIKFEGTAALSNITVTTVSTYGIQIRGDNKAVTPTISLDNVVISGTVTKVGLLIQEFADLSNFSLNNVDLSGVTAGWAPMAVAHTGTTPLNIGNTKLPASTPGTSLAIWNTGGVDATSAVFVGASDNFDIEDHVGHKLDLSTLGLVTWVSNNVYVTPGSGSVQRGVDAVASGSTVNVNTGTFTDTVTINKDNILLQGAGIGQTVLQGSVDCTTSNGNVGGIALSQGISGTTISDLTVTGFDDGVQMFTGPITNTLIKDAVASSNCRHGIYTTMSSGFSGLTLQRVKASNNNVVGAQRFGRGIWVINGVKQNITIEDSTFNNNRLVGIDISDGNVTNLLITGNQVISNGDSGIGVLGPQGSGSTLVDSNTVVDNGRFGIEIKNPTGNGASSGADSVVVSNNVVSRTVTPTDMRDHSGIGIFRRGPNPTYNADQPSGVVISGNIVSGYLVTETVGATGEGFGIVVEGTGHTVISNTVENNDIGLQLQAGNPSANQQNTAYFDRGNALTTTNSLVLNNTASSNMYGIRSIGLVAGVITANTVYTNTQNGVTVLNEASTGILINNNKICQNGVFGVENQGSSNVDATNNWWDATDGPGPVGTGSGDKVSANVTYSPFTTSNGEGPCTVFAPAPAGSDIYLPIIVKNAS